MIKSGKSGKKKLEIHRKVLCWLLAGALAAGVAGSGENVLAAGVGRESEAETSESGSKAGLAGLAELIHAHEAGRMDVQEREIENAELAALAEDKDILALVYLCQEYGLHSGASRHSGVTENLSCGQTVFIKDAFYNEEEQMLWLYVEFEDVLGAGSGYIERTNLACSDERFLQWEEACPWSQEVSPVTGNGEAAVYAAGGVSKDIAQFPESYQSALTLLKNSHPKWIFVPMETGLEWDTVITKELAGGKSLVHKSLPDYMKEGAYDNGSWFFASKEILEYYMDPRNGITEDRIFQFELLTYNATYHTEAAVESFLANTFMKSPAPAPGTEMTFAHIFWAIGAEEGREVSPFHLAARVYQEQGQGTSGLISGTYPGYEGYYNYFNVGASGTTTAQVIESGLKYAKEHNWYNAYFSILGGADVISAGYIKKGQDTLYLQKYNVNPKASNALYTHQYMQNISAPATEGSSIRKLYAKADSLDNSFVFKIPVYKNMPAAACPYPKFSTNVVLQIPTGYSSDTIWVEGVPYAAESRNNRQIVKAADDKAVSAVVYSYNKDKVPTGMYVWTLQYKNNGYVVTGQENLKDLLGYEGFSIRISGEPGIRVKTSIEEELKEKLVGAGVGGYKLKEYGTLAADQADLKADPLVKDGRGVSVGMAYGTDSQGQKQDLVYETVDGRQRFTSVLVGLPAEKYKNVYSFRGYAVLKKDGVEYIVYGPVMSRSMVTLAQQVMASGDYEKSSDAYAYLEQIVADAK